MIQFSKDYLYDKIYACWVGKNIGGTLGTPYEGTREYLDIAGFASKTGEPLPNDDLDLQLAWLRAVNDLGPENINSKTLGEYWLSWVNPHWNEYGEGKANMRDGIVPPISGEFNNKYWRDSNGAWIRTEVWACLYPTVVEKAIRYAFEDASVDHGFGEGTWAAIFVAAMESAAFVVSDANKLLEIGLGKIPEKCRVAQSVKLVMDCYQKGLSCRECRDAVVADSADLGWFQAPANVAYVVLGLLYGEGDFKKSLIYAVDCGDDTDCTGATLGALMGIMNGMAGIPSDWQEYIGDGIKSVCLTNGHGRFPENNKELTNCIFNLLPVTLRRHHQEFLCPIIHPEWEDRNYVAIGEENDFSELNVDAFIGREFASELEARKPYSFTQESVFANALVEYDAKPVISPNGTLTGSISLTANGNLPGQSHYRLTYYLPEGWSVESEKNIYTHAPGQEYLNVENKAHFTIHAGEKVEAVNSVLVEITVSGRMLPIIIPMRIIG